MISIDLYMFLDAHMQGFKQDMHLEVKLLGYRVCSCSIYQVAAKHFLKRLPSESSNCCMSLPALSIARLLNICLSYENVTIFHCFDLHFPISNEVEYLLMCIVYCHLHFFCEIPKSFFPPILLSCLFFLLIYSCSLQVLNESFILCSINSFICGLFSFF